MTPFPAGPRLPGTFDCHHDGPRRHLLLHGGEVLPECAHHRGSWGDGRLGIHCQVCHYLYGQCPIVPLRDAWDKILTKLGLEDIEISDNRYNHIVHLQSAAIGAEKFYTTEDHAAR